MHKPWYAHLYIKSPIVKIVIGILSVLLSMFLVVVLAFVLEPPRMQAQAANWEGRSIEKGAEIWNNNCFTCHGPEGKGGAGPALNSKYFFTQRLNDLSYSGSLKDYVKSTVASGRPSKVVSQWSVMMPTWSARFGGPLRDDQIEYVTNFVLNWESSALQQTNAEDPWIPFQDAPSKGPVGGETVGGTVEQVEASGPRPPQDLFNKDLPNGMGCHACHNINAPQTDTERGPIGPNLGNLYELAGTFVPGLSAEDYVRASILQPNDYIVEGYLPNIMPQTFGEKMTEEEINGLVAWILDPNRQP